MHSLPGSEGQLTDMGTGPHGGLVSLARLACRSRVGSRGLSLMDPPTLKQYFRRNDSLLLGVKREGGWGGVGIREVGPREERERERERAASLGLPADIRPCHIEISLVARLLSRRDIEQRLNLYIMRHATL